MSDPSAGDWLRGVVFADRARRELRIPSAMRKSEPSRSRLLELESHRTEGSALVWYEDARWRSRLQAEQVVMNARFPQFVLRQDSDRSLLWEGVLEPIESELFHVRIDYPRRYPYEKPTLWVIDPPLPRNCPHVYQSGAICVYRDSWEASRSTAASLVPLLAAWLVAFIAWRDTGRGF